MNSVIFYQPPANINGHKGRFTTPRNLLSSALYKYSLGNSARNHFMDDATRRLDKEAVLSHVDGPRHRLFRPSVSATSQSLNGLDTLADSDDEFFSVTALLSRAQPVALRAAPKVIDPMVEPSNDVSYLHKFLDNIGR